MSFFSFSLYQFLALENDPRYLSAEEQSRELTRSITREVAKLSEQWNQLIDHSDNWKHSLDEFMTVSFTLLSHQFRRVWKSIAFIAEQCSVKSLIQFRRF